MKKTLAILALLLSLLLCGCMVYLEPAVPIPQGDGLTVHYIDVGQADSILLECDGQYLLIDGGNREDGQLVVS